MTMNLLKKKKVYHLMEDVVKELVIASLENAAVNMDGAVKLKSIVA